MKRYANAVLVVLIGVGGIFLLILTVVLLFPALRVRQRARIASAPAVAQMATVTPRPSLTPSPELPFSAPGFIIPTAPPAFTAVPTRPSSVSVLEEPTLQGIFLNISGPGLPPDYRVGPIARGGYAVGPNDRFLIYVSNSGFVYGLRLGNPHFIRLQNLKHTLIASDLNAEPAITLDFVQAEYLMVVLIHEGAYGQTIPLPLPRTLTN